jgi:hypothetical protein
LENMGMLTSAWDLLDPWNALAFVNFRFLRSGEGGS